MSTFRMQQRRGTTANCTACEDVLRDGEIVVEKCTGGTFKMKVGDGEHKFSELPYVACSDTVLTLLEKNKLTNIAEGAQVNLIETIKVNGTSQTITNKAVDITVPTKTSDLTNDSGFLTSHQDISGKVDKITGKGLSTNDYDNAAKTKVDAIPANPQYTDTVYDDTVLSGRVTTIEGKIPEQASSSNKLADKAFVNSSIGTNTAYYISNNGQPFTSVAQLEAYSGTITNNDYAFVTGTENGNSYYDRYKATVNGSTVTWAKEYRLNNSSFTAVQWDAINSGLTNTSLSSYRTASAQDVIDSSKANTTEAGYSLDVSGTSVSLKNKDGTVLSTITTQDTDTTYSVATTSTDGLMSSTDKSKLDGIDASANNYSLPVASSTLGGVKSGTDITVDASGNVSVNDNSHNHTIANVTGLQSALDGKINKATNVTVGNIPELTSAGEVIDSNFSMEVVSAVDPTSPSVVNAEDISNKTQVIDSNSTAQQYPSAAAVYTETSKIKEDLADLTDFLYESVKVNSVSIYSPTHSFIVTSYDSLEEYVNKWYSAPNINCALLPVSFGEKFFIKNLDTVKKHGYAFLTTGNVGVTGDTPDYVAGYETPQIIDAGGYTEVTIPEGTKYLAYFEASSPILEVFKIVNSSVLDDYKQVDKKRYYFGNAFIVSQYDGMQPSEVNKWYRANGVSSIFIPVNENDVYLLKNTNTQKIHCYAFLTSRIYGNTGDTPAYATGYESLQDMAKGAYAKIKIPNGVNYLVFFDSNAPETLCYKYEPVDKENYFGDVFQFTTGNDAGFFNQRRSFVTLKAPNPANENIDNVLAIQNTSNVGVPGNCAINFLDSAGTEKCAIGYSHNSTIDGSGGYHPDTCYIEIGNAFSADRNSDVKLSVISTRNGINPRQIVILTVNPDGQIDLYPNALGTGKRVIIHGDLEVTGQIISGS